MSFTEEALQQASSPEIADYHAAIFDQLNLETPVADLGCGIGGDILAFASQQRVLAVEKDPIRCRLAWENIRVCGVSPNLNLICAFWTSLTPPVHGAYIDPNRRVSTSMGDRKRVCHLNQMEPPISVIMSLLDTVKNNLAVKVVPGVSHDESPHQAEVSFISVRGQMKEALLRFGRLRTGVARTAVLLPGGHTVDSQLPFEKPVLREPGAYLYEPDAAVIRATWFRM